MTEVDRQWGALADRLEEDVLVEDLPVPTSLAVPQVTTPTPGPSVDVGSRPQGLGVARLDAVAARALEIGLKRVQVLAWRDFVDPEAGGSELHAHRVASAWARVGIDVTMRSSAAPGQESVSTRAGYQVIRKSGRYGVFPRSALSGLVGRRGRPDGLVEIWNGMPFFTPLWARCPRIVLLHHVHAAMWKMVLPPRLARLGEAVELKIAPPLYRHSRVLTLSTSSRQEILTMLKLDASRVSVVPPGVDERFGPGGAKSPVPLVVAVGRLVPVKRLELLIDAAARARQVVPDLRLLVIGEGYERPALEAKVESVDGRAWIDMPGHVSDDELADVYRRAWVLASTSLREGWNMTVTEAGACGTPAVVSDIAGHRDSLAGGVSGLLVDPGDDFVNALVQVLTSTKLRDSLARGAMARARRLTWEATAANVLDALVEEAEARR
ncbi:MAG TPA: glycosyltransferase family 4 protein [Acidimicrobiales bacterium]|nr:glycosyltransferase family 4 protein [Acidimicrobiales bacterium]